MPGSLPADIADPPATLSGKGSLPAGTAPTYVPLLRGGRRHWDLPGAGEVLDPHWDPAMNSYRFTRNGQNFYRAWSPELAWHVCSQVRGYCSPAQGRALYELAAAATGPIAEIGSAEGLSACWLGLAARDTGQPLTCVDTFTGPLYHQWRVNIRDRFDATMAYAGLSPRVLAMPSQDAASAYPGGPLHLLYIDGSHSYAAARADWHAWSQRLAPGAVVCFDDCTGVYPGIMRLQAEIWHAGRAELLGRTGAMLAWRL